MPIILDQNNALDPKDMLKQVAQVSQQVNSARDVGVKWFHDALTGGSRRKSGLFNTDLNTFGQMTKSSFNKLGISHENKSLLGDMVNNCFIDFFSKEKDDKAFFAQFARVATSLVWPSLFSTERVGNYYTTHTLMDAMSLSDQPIQWPSSSPLFNSMNVSRWAELSYENGVRTVVCPLIQSVALHSAKITSGSATQKNSFSVAPDLVVFLAVASFTDDVKPEANMTLSAKGVTPDDMTIPLTIIPVVSHAQTTYLMNTYIGVDWHALMNSIKSHFDKAKLTDLNISARGTSDVMRTEQDIIDTINELSLSDALDSQAKVIVHQPENIMMDTVAALVDFMDRTKGHKMEKHTEEATVRSLRIIMQTMEHLSHKEDNLISTDLLNDLYNQLKSSSFSADSQSQIIQESLRLLLSQRLHELQSVEDAGQLHKFDPQDDAIKNRYLADPSYSSQQKRIVTSTQPLVIGQAGAGSGKSHTLIGRIKYLEEQKEDMAKVLVLSFTNVSALNINQRFPGIRSETLANMFNQIYQNTYPAQQLSQPSTVANSLKMLNTDAPFFKSKGFTSLDVAKYIGQFSATLSQLDQTGYKRVNVQEVTKQLANLIQHNMVLTEILLDAVEQTTLELQPIIIHHHLMTNHGHLNVPQQYQNLDYIITDESQDISTFEYILLLELAIHHSAQLMIVGDGSQTLYEFRNSDPKYMNALESSGVFTTYKLDVNYRSKPEVLLLANQFLDVIEANDIANIQLKSTNFAQPTKKSFEEAITIHNTLSASSKPADFHESLLTIIQDSPEFSAWFSQKLDNGEQVAILGWTRTEVIKVGEAITQWLLDNNRNIEVTNIMNDKTQPMVVISNTLSEIHADILALDPSTNTFPEDVKELARTFIKNKYHRASTKQVAFFGDTFARAVDSIVSQQQWGIIRAEVKAGKLSKRAGVGHLTREMLRLETRKNAMEAHLHRAEEAPDYSQKRIILSTIHGAKGLEFDNTIVLFNESKRGSTSQESMRMLFVALSRAKKTEYIINSHVKTQIGASNLLSAMFETPMQTAFMRAQDQIEATQLATNGTTAATNNSVATITMKNPAKTKSDTKPAEPVV